MTARFHTALITGATSGIGEQLAHLLACEGLRLLLVGRDRERLAKLANELAPMVDVHPLFCDLARPEERASLVRVIHDEAPDLVVNCAGLAFYGNALHHETKSHLRVVEVNDAALVELTLEAARTLIARKAEGVIVNVSSIISGMVCPGAAIYAASKAFVDSFSQAVDVEFSPYGVRVLTACPGQVATEFLMRASGGKVTSHPRGAMVPTDCAKAIWHQIQKGDRIYRFNWKYRWIERLVRLLPKSLLYRRLYALLSERSDRQTICPPETD